MSIQIKLGTLPQAALEAEAELPPSCLGSDSKKHLMTSFEVENLLFGQEHSTHTGERDTHEER